MLEPTNALAHPKPAAQAWIDPSTQLPLDAFQCVLQHLDARDAAEARHVSRAWRGAIEGMLVDPPHLRAEGALKAPRVTMRDALTLRLAARADRIEDSRQELRQLSYDMLQRARSMSCRTFGYFFGQAVPTVLDSWLQMASMGARITVYHAALTATHLGRGATALGAGRMDDAREHVHRAGDALARGAVQAAAHGVACAGLPVLFFLVLPAYAAPACWDTYDAGIHVVVAPMVAAIGHGLVRESRELPRLIDRRLREAALARRSRRLKQL